VKPAGGSLADFGGEVESDRQEVVGMGARSLLARIRPRPASRRAIGEARKCWGAAVPALDNNRTGVKRAKVY
jgi:hypothetical protein